MITIGCDYKLGLSIIILIMIPGYDMGKLYVLMILYHWYKPSI